MIQSWLDEKPKNIRNKKVEQVISMTSLKTKAVADLIKAGWDYEDIEKLFKPQLPLFGAAVATSHPFSSDSQRQLDDLIKRSRKEPQKRYWLSSKYENSYKSPLTDNEIELAKELLDKVFRTAEEEVVLDELLKVARDDYRLQGVYWAYDKYNRPYRSAKMGSKK